MRVPRGLQLLALVIAACCAAGVAPVRADATGGWLWPVEGPRTVLLGYGDTYTGADGLERTHRGIDAECDGEVVACTPGTVSFAGTVPGDGGGRVYAVTLLTGDGLKVTLMPLDGISVGPGDEVSEGDTVADGVTSGDASSPDAHLHVSVRRGDAYLDPSAFFAEQPLAPAHDAPPTEAPVSVPTRPVAKTPVAKTPVASVVAPEAVATTARATDGVGARSTGRAPAGTAQGAGEPVSSARSDGVTLRIPTRSGAAVPNPGAAAGAAGAAGALRTQHAPVVSAEHASVAVVAWDAVRRLRLSAAAERASASWHAAGRLALAPLAAVIAAGCLWAALGKARMPLLARPVPVRVRSK